MLTYRKILGLSLAAILAVAAVSASAAGAAEFEGGSEPTFLLGEQEEKNVFTVSGFAVECNNAVFEGQTPSHAASVTVHPTYTNCTWFGEAEAFDTTGCDFVLHVGTAGTGKLEITCEEGAQITRTSSPCTLYIGPQEIPAAVSYENVGGEVLVSFATGENIDIAKKEGPLCGLFGNTMAYQGSMLMAGFADAPHTVPVGLSYVP